jgi:phage pi2 protein 07
VSITKDRIDWTLINKIDNLITQIRYRCKLILKKGEFVKYENNKESKYEFM